MQNPTPHTKVTQGSSRFNPQIDLVTLQKVHPKYTSKSVLFLFCFLALKCLNIFIFRDPAFHSISNERKMVEDLAFLKKVYGWTDNSPEFKTRLKLMREEMLLAQRAHVRALKAKDIQQTIELLKTQQQKVHF